MTTNRTGDGIVIRNVRRTSDGVPIRREVLTSDGIPARITEYPIPPQPTFEVTIVPYARMEMPKRKTYLFDKSFEAMRELERFALAACTDYSIDHIEFRKIRARPQ